MQDPHEHHGLRLGSFAGSPLFIEPSFFFLCAMFVLISLNRGEPIHFALLWIPILFVSTIIHELGHSLMIKALGFGNSVIALGGFGGVTMNARRARPWQEILISLAGPVLGAAFGFLCLYLTPTAVVQNDRMLQVLLPRAWQANIFWAIFNLLPIYPLDGGKVLRSFTRIVMSNLNSFATTCWVSMIFAGVLIVWGLTGRNFFLVVIAASLLYENYKMWAHYKGTGFTE